MKRYMGVDPGRNIGVAVWNATKQEFEVVKTFYDDFWGFISFCVVCFPDDNEDELIAIVENSNLCKKNWQKNAMSTGKNQQLSQLIVDFFKFHGIETHEINPTSRKGSDVLLRAKKDEGFFKELTGYTGRTSEHARDAAMMVWKRA
jgi:hypothetical protein